MKKLLAVLLIMTMSISMFTACGGSDKEANKETNKESNKESNSENDTNVNQDDDVSTDEGSVYVVEVDDPGLAEAIQMYYQMTIDEPANPEGYMALAELYMQIGEMKAAVDVAKAGYKSTGKELFNDIIQWASSDTDTPDDETKDSETTEKEESTTPELAKNQCIMGSEKLGYYRVTFDEDYVYTRKEKFSYGWVHFDDKGVQINYSVEAFENFEAFYAKQKQNLDWNVEENLIADLVIGETKQVKCGNVTAYYFEYSYTDCSDKVVEPVAYRMQKFYVDFGDGVGVYGSTDKFLDDGYSYSDTNGSRKITIEEYLKYVFVHVEKIEQ